jgi:DNA polymerase III epsilon subunit family exonuclease
MPPFTLIVLDTETTGLDFKTEQIIELAAVRLEDGKITDTFHSLVKPTVPIRQSSQKVHGIDVADLADAPLMPDILPQFMAFIGDLPYVAHSAYNDYSFINQATRTHMGQGFNNHRIDTYDMFRQLFPDEPSHGMGALLARFGLPPHDAHRALEDAMALAQVYPQLAAMYEEKNRWRINQLPNVNYLLERYGAVRDLQKHLQAEMAEIKEIFRLHFEQGGKALVSTQGDKVTSERKRSYKIDEKALWALLKDTAYGYKVFKLQSKNLSRIIHDLDPELKAPVLASRSDVSETVTVQFSRVKVPTSVKELATVADEADTLPDVQPAERF